MRLTIRVSERLVVDCQLKVFGPKREPEPFSKASVCRYWRCDLCSTFSSLWTSRYTIQALTATWSVCETTFVSVIYWFSGHAFLHLQLFLSLSSATSILTSSLCSHLLPVSSGSDCLLSVSKRSRSCSHWLSFILCLFLCFYIFHGDCVHCVLMSRSISSYIFNIWFKIRFSGSIDIHLMYIL